MDRKEAIMKRIVLAAATLAALAGPALAQYSPYGPGGGGGYGGGYGRGYSEDDDDGRRRRRWERRREREEYGYGRPRMGSVCVTSRGNCVTRPAPFNAPCGCEVPGFGFKRGAIGG